MGSKAFESPLISHARMRAMYHALVQVRALLAQAKLRSLRGMEACWVGTAIDLKEGDLTSDTGVPLEPLLLAHVRAVGNRAAGAAMKTPELRRMVKQIKQKTSGSFPGSAYDRVLCALGAGMAQQAAGQQGISLAYAGLAELSGPEWTGVFKLMGQAGLPFVLVVLPGESKIDLEALALRAAGDRDAAVPVVPVDAGDAVALYRVAQETILRARTGGGAGVILGITCGTDGVKLLGTQLVRKRICTERWVQGVDRHLKGLLASV